jgi:hypothetical protein
MKRVAPLLFFLIFCLGNVGGRALHLHHHLAKTSHHGVHSAIFSDSEDSSANPNDFEPAVNLPGDLDYAAEDFRLDLLALDVPGPAAQRQDHHSGLGCGGLFA